MCPESGDIPAGPWSFREAIERVIAEMEADDIAVEAYELRVVTGGILHRMLRRDVGYSPVQLMSHPVVYVKSLPFGMDSCLVRVEGG